MVERTGDQSIIRHISVRDVQEARLSESRIIENYPHDKYGPSCLILGFTKEGRPLHIQVSYPSRPGRIGAWSGLGDVEFRCMKPHSRLENSEIPFSRPRSFFSNGSNSRNQRLARGNKSGCRGGERKSRDWPSLRSDTIRSPVREVRRCCVEGR